MRIPQRSSKAFTLIELIVVIVILGILALIAIPTFGKVIAKSQDESALSSLRAIARNAQALRALDQTTTWGAAPQDAITETSMASSTGVFAATTKATSDSGVDPVKGEVVYKVVDTDRLALSALSPSGKICMVGLTVTAVTSGKCVMPHPVAGATPVSTLSGEVQSDTSLLPAPSSTGGTGSTPPPATNTGLNAAYRQYGTTSSERFTAAAVGSDGTLYGVGYISNGTLGASSYGGVDIIVMALRSDGTQKWVKQYGTAGNDYGQAVKVGNDGTVYLTGYTTGALTTSPSAGSADIYVMALDPVDGIQKWAKQYGGSGGDYAYGLDLDASGNIYVAGHTDASFASASQGNTDFVVMALNSVDGTQKWAKQYGGSGGEYGYGISAGQDGNIYLTGFTNGSFAGASKGDNDMVVVAVQAANGSQLWTQQYGTSGNDIATGVVAANGTLYVAGLTHGALDGPSKGLRDVAVLALNTTNGTQKWVKQYGGSDSEQATSIQRGGDGTIYVGGYTTGTFGSAPKGDNDAFGLALNSDGTQKWVKQYGGSGSDVSQGAVVAPDGTLYLVGNTASNLAGANSGGDDIMVVKIN